MMVIVIGDEGLLIDDDFVFVFIDLLLLYIYIHVYCNRMLHSQSFIVVVVTHTKVTRLPVTRQVA